MATFGTTFKRIYGEGLKKYGFKKIKGRQPYFVRMIGDEIIHVITYRPVNAYNFSHKEYEIYGGIATVYRANIDLDKTPRDNAVWLRELYRFYRKCNDGREKKKYEEIGLFSYEKDNEQAMIESIEYSFEMTEKYVITELNKITDIKKCVEFFGVYHPIMLTLSSEFENRENQYEYNEGLLNVFVYSPSKYIEYEKNQYEKQAKILLDGIKMGIYCISMEEYENDLKKDRQAMNNQIEIFNRMINDKEEYKKVLNELKKRKISNSEILKKYEVNSD